MNAAPAQRGRLPVGAEWLLAMLPLLLGAASFVVLLDQDIKAASINEPLDVVINTLAALVAVAVAALGWVHFQESGDAAPLLRASAFLTLGAVNALLLVVSSAGLSLAFGLDLSAPGQLPILATVMSRGTASVLLLLAGWAALRGWSANRWPGLLVMSGPALVIIALVTVAATVQSMLPSLLGSAELQALHADPTAPLVVFGAKGLVAIRALISLAYLGAAALAYRTYRRDGGTLDAFLAAGLIIAAFSEVQSAVHPGVFNGLVTLGDLGRVAFYAVLFVALSAERREGIRALRRANAELVLLRESEVEAATAAERARLAREIHDGMSQELWFAKLKQARLTEMDLPPEAEALASEVAGALDSALAEARQAILALRPAEEASFSQVLARFVADFSDRFGLVAECACDPAVDGISSRAQAELLRICHEALTNARKHADPTVVQVSIVVTDGTLKLVIFDNGRGFDPALIRDSRYGLRSMGERAELIGGRLTVETGTQDGTRLVVEVPMEAVR